MQLSLEQTAAMTMLECQILFLEMVSWLPKLIPLHMTVVMASHKTVTFHVLKCRFCDQQKLFYRITLSIYINAISVALSYCNRNSA